MSASGQNLTPESRSESDRGCPSNAARKRASTELYIQTQHIASSSSSTRLVACMHHSAILRRTRTTGGLSMGQRHQIFIIARVQGRHRCVAAFRSQWLFGRMVINAAGRVASALVNPLNAAAIASELATLEGLDLDAIVHQDNGDFENPAILCPYLTTLVLTSCRVDLVMGDLYDTSIWHSYLLPSQCDNDEGYTCFDVTAPGKPWHCFWWRGSGPLTAFQYLSRSTAKEKRCRPDLLAALGHCPLLELSTLAAVWPSDFSGLSQQQEAELLGRSDATSLPYSPITRSAASAYDTLNDLQLSGVLRVSIERLLMGLLSVIRNDEERRGAGSEGAPVVSPSAVSAASAIRDILSSPRQLGLTSIQSTLESLVIGPGHLDVLRTELLAVKELNGNGVILLKRLLAAENARAVDLKPWVSTGALDASMLLDLSDALQQAEQLDLSLSSTLTAEIVQELVPRLQNLKHLIALGCTRLTSLTTALPLTSYFASLPLHDAVDQNRLQEPGLFSPPECLRWVEESDPPAGLSIVMFSPSLSILSQSPETRRYGVELAHFGAEGVVLGFAFWLERLYNPEYRPGMGTCYFEMRAYFHSTGFVDVEKCISAEFDSSPSFTFGCLPSLIKDVSTDGGQVYPRMETPAATDGVTRIPRHPGWVLVFDTKGTMPFHQILQTMSPLEVNLRDLDRLGIELAFSEDPLVPTGSDTNESINDARRPPDDTFSQSQSDTTPSGDGTSSPLPDASTTPTATIASQVITVSVDSRSSAPAPGDAPHQRDGLASPSPRPPDNVPRPEYAFEWWDVRPGEEARGLHPLERLSVREWVERLPVGHSSVDQGMLVYCEHVLARLHVVLRGSNPERLATK